MIEKREKEWQELETKAFQMLENPSFLSKDTILKFCQPILRLWIYPSFEPHKMWIFYEPDFRTIQPKTLIVRQVVWDRNDDGQRLNDPLKGLKEGFHTEPTFEIKSIEITKENFNKMFDELQNIQFPAFANYKKSIGIDGVRCGIETYDFTHHTNIYWWSVYPKEWQNLVNWFNEAKHFLEIEFSEI